MTVSILLPTRNGGAQLAPCIRSVLDQPGESLELVVSDNASDDPSREVLASFDDPRLRVVRQPEPLSVTDNWQKALEAATGDYVLLIGDDDALLPGSVTRMQELLAEFGHPQVLSFEAYGFAFPGAFGEGSPAYYSDPLFPYSDRLPRRGELPRAARRERVVEFFDFEFTFCPNLQTTLVAREALLHLRNGPFHEPYPDFYAINALLLVAERWAHAPEQLTIVGISPKSFGRTLKGGGTEEGRAYLQIDTQFEGWLPGTDMLNGTYRYLQALKRDYGPELAGVEISRSNYVYRQGYAWYLAFRLGEIDRRELGRRLRMLSPRDYAGFVRELVRRVSPAMIRRHARPNQQSSIDSVWPNMRPIPGVDSLESFRAWAGERAHATAAS